MKKFVTYLTVSALAFGIAMPAALAETTASASTTVQVTGLIASLQAQINDLQAKLANLKSAQIAVQTTEGDVQVTLKAIGELKQGMTSDQVAQIQAILAADKSVYPQGLVTGHYGPLTARAVAKFREKYEKRQEKMSDRMKAQFEKMHEKMAKMKENHEKKMDKMEEKIAKKFCHVPPGLLRAPGFEKTHQDEWNRLWKDWRSCNDGNATTTPDRTAPAISAVVSVNVASTTATVNWTTNESGTSKVYYASTTPVNLSTALNVSNTTLITAHSLGLSGLTASTTYHFVIESKDASNNTATSSEQSFTTTAS